MPKYETYQESMITDSSSFVAPRHDRASRFASYSPSPEEKIIVQDCLQTQNTLVTLWREFTAHNQAPCAVFRREQAIEFILDGAASNFFVELGSPFTIELISFDLRTQNPQPLYSFQTYGHLTSEYFRVKFQAPALVAGFFRLQSILLIDNTEHFAIPSGANFIVL